MALQQISKEDIAGWDSLDAIANTFKKRNLKTRENLGEENELVLQLTDTEFIVIVEAGAGESATDFKPDNRNRRTNLVATNDYEEFTFLTRIRSWEGQQHGRIKHQKLSFTKEQMTSESGEKNTVLQKLNSIEYGSADAIQDTLYDTKQVVKEFYQQFEELRTDLVQEVSNIPDDRGDAKQRYVQVLLDRMIFLYFIQEKRLLDRNIEYLHEKHDAIVDEGGDVYDEFYHPLFFEMLAEGKQDPDFGSLPYLNGGLFSKNPVEEEFEDARLGESSEETNEYFGDILDFLSDWNWNVDERLDVVDPKNLSPAILGHIFEQTVNQKEMGAYYTPEDITGFMARRTIHPYLLDQLNEAIDDEYEEIDDIFGFPAVDSEEGATALADGGAITAQVPTANVETRHIETLYHDVLTEAHVLDPAVGSGAFLLAAQEVLLDIYMQCIEYFQQLDTEEKAWKLENRTRDELEKIEQSQGEAPLYAKRSIILNNLYGVDIDQGAVEICKLRLWLSMVADIEDEPKDVEPLPNIDFNIRQGNSLVGFTGMQEIVNQDGDTSLANYGGGISQSVREMFDDVIAAVERHREADSAKEAASARNVAESHIEEHSRSLNEKIVDQYHQAGVEDIELSDIREYSPFHWVIEFALVYDSGGFDVVIGNPPWDVITASRDDYFSKFDETFRTRPPDEKDNKQEELLADTTIAEGWEQHKDEMETRAAYFNKGGQYTLQNPTVDGRAVGSENDLSMLFFERVFDLAREEGYIAQILPGVIFNGAAAKDLRLHALEETSVRDIIGFENRGIFEDLHFQYRFGIITLQNSGETDIVNGIFSQTDTDVLRSVESGLLNIPKSILLDYSPEARIFPYIDSQQEVNVLKKILKHPPTSEDIDDTWYLEPYSELHKSQDSDRFIEDSSEGTYPVIGGRHIHQYAYNPKMADSIATPSLWSVNENENPEKSAKRRVREKNYRRLKKELYESFNGSGSQKGFVNDLLKRNGRGELSEDDVLLDCTEYRIVYREIARPTDERTMIATVIPPNVTCYHKLHTIRPYEVSPSRDDLGDTPLHSVYERVFDNQELFAAVGLLNSIPFDFLMRTKIDSSIVMYKFAESQMPRLTEGDDYFHYIADRAASLNCYGQEFTEMRSRLGGIEPATDQDERRELRAEIDGAAFHAYGLERREVKFVLDDFHRVENPRLMDEEYFDMVFEKFDRLTEEGPMD